MADITLSSNSYIKPYRAAKGSALVRHIMGSTFAANSSIVIGDVVVSDTNSGSTAPYMMIRMIGTGTAPSTAIYGIAAGNVTHDGSTGVTGAAGPTTAKTPVWIAERDSEFVSVTKTAGTNSTSIGRLASLKRDSTLGIWYADLANSTAGDAIVRITGVLNPGDTNGLVTWRFISTACFFTD